MLNITYAAATMEDIEPIYQLNKSLIDQYESMNNIDYDKVLSWVHRKCEKCIGEYTCIYADGEKAGYYRFAPSDDGKYEIDDLYVFPAFQNHGIGSTVVEKCCSSVTTPVILYVFARNFGALALYKRHGFKVIKSVQNTRFILQRDCTDTRTDSNTLQCRAYPLNSLKEYKYTVICSNYCGKWILSQHKKRDTWETQGGHIESGESPMECARRELFEESGIRDAELYPVCDYLGFQGDSHANGVVYLAVIHSLGELPESEMARIQQFDVLPENLTYPETTPELIAHAGRLLLDLNEQMCSNLR